MQENSIDEIQRLARENFRYVKSLHEHMLKDTGTKENEVNKVAQEILQYQKASFAILEKMQRWIFWNRVFTVLKIVIIAVPIVLGIIFLPPLLERAFGPYVELLSDVKKLQP